MTQLNETVLENIQAMRCQEIKSYQVSTELLMKAASDAERAGFPIDMQLYLLWRSQMIEWCYSLTSICDFKKETVEVAVSILDRFVIAQTELLSDAHKYQLACIAALYTAIKINEQRCFSPQQMEQLSGYRFAASDIERIELEILPAIGWRVHPPTASSYCIYLLELLPQAIVPDRKAVLEVAETHTQLAIGNEAVLTANTSSLALASLLNALQCVLPNSTLSKCKTLFCRALSLDEASIQSNLDRLQQLLQSLVARSFHSGLIHSKAMLAAYKQLPTGNYLQSHSVEKDSHSVAAGRSPRGVVDTQGSIKALTAVI